MSYLVSVEVQALKDPRALELFCQRQKWKLSVTGNTAQLQVDSSTYLSVDLKAGKLSRERYSEQTTTAAAKLLGANDVPTEELLRCGYMALLEENKIHYVEMAEGDILIDVDPTRLELTV